MNQVPITFDRRTGRLQGANLFERGIVLALQAVAKATWPIHHRGYSIFCRLLSPFARKRELVVRLNDDALFALPLGDGYWSRMLDRSDVYEEDLDHFLRHISGVDYVFVDCGANFGLWSVLVSSKPFGSRPVVAIEASSANTAKLERNANLNGDRFKVLHRAVGGSTGGTAWLSGAKHEAFSIVEAGARGPGEEVAVVALDNLLDTGAVQAGQRVVVKLDVEGVEIDALKGGRRLLAGDAILICEEHGSDPAHAVTRYLMNEAGYRVFVLEPKSGRFELLTDLATLDRIKAVKRIGYNVFATASRFWEEQLLSAKPLTT
jgi:FkbM family methyltransferase